MELLQKIRNLGKLRQPEKLEKLLAALSLKEVKTLNTQIYMFVIINFTFKCVDYCCGRGNRQPEGCDCLLESHSIELEHRRTDRRSFQGIICKSK